MTEIEDRLRAAVHAAADTVADDSAPPLRLTRQPARGRAPRLQRRDRRTPGQRTPGPRTPRRQPLAVIAAATAALAVIGATAAVASYYRQHAASSGGAVSVPLLRAPAFDGGAVPAYYVAALGRTSRLAAPAQIRATATGALLAEVRPPSPFPSFIAVTAAANDRAFVLAAQLPRQGPTSLFLLQLEPQDSTARLSRLPITVTTNHSLQLAGLALSPDGSKLAFAVNNWATRCICGAQIWTYDLATGSHREWTWPGASLMTSPSAKGQASLSWAGNDKTLAFEIDTGLATSVRVIDTAAGGTNLGKSRRVLGPYLATSDPVVWIESPVLTADGTTIALGQEQITGQERFAGAGPTSEKLSIEEYSARTGLSVAMIYRHRYRLPASQNGNSGPPPAVLWANAAGSVLIVSTGAAVSEEGGAIGVLRDGRFTPLTSLQLATPATDGPVAW
jgi:hypothetical protein